MDNMDIYNRARTVPTEARKQINAGRLKGMTDINPMWRIKCLTELFGPGGIGWWYEITKKEIVYDELTNTKAAFVDILLYYFDPASGEQSKGIPGTGGSSFVAQESKGAYMNDECFKMALTDAISVAAKALGVGADVYWDKDRTKYSKDTQQTGEQTQAQEAEPLASKKQVELLKKLFTAEQLVKMCEVNHCDTLYGITMAKASEYISKKGEKNNG